MTPAGYIILFLLAAFFVALLAYAAHIVYLMRQLDVASEQARRYSVCPACHRVIRLTWFMCRCGQAHELIPTEKEVFYKQCSCGQRLPKVPQQGRDELVALCPHHHPYYPIGKYTGTLPEVVIPIIGSMAAGKSAFLAAWTVFTQGQLQYQFGVDVTYPFDGGPKYATDCVQRFQQGAPIPRTSIRNPVSFGMDIVSRTSRKGIRLFLYDPAGEVFDPLGGESENSLAPFGYYDFMDGAIFVIDPFSLPALRRKYSQSQLNDYGLVASDKQTDDTCEKFIRGMYEHGLDRDKYHYASCAVVITKADAFDLDSLIGKAAAQKNMADDPDLSFEDALDEVCSTKLEEWGMGRVLELLDSHFKEVRCFSVSAFGHKAQPGVPYAPQRVELPILWLLRKQRNNVFVSR